MKLTFKEWMKALSMFLISIPLELSSFVYDEPKT